MSQSKQDVLASAKKLEQDGRKFYLDVAAKSKNQLARRMFQSLADDELKHIEWIDKHSPGGYTGTDAKKESYQRLKSIFADVPESMRKEVEATDDDIKALDLALEMESKSRDAYAKWAKESHDAEVKELCTVLADVEQYHYDLLTNTKEYFEHTADWFMEEENWMFDGG